MWKVLFLFGGRRVCTVLFNSRGNAVKSEEGAVPATEFEFGRIRSARSSKEAYAAQAVGPLIMTSAEEKPL